MRKSTHRWPEFEALDTLTLLSGIAAAPQVAVMGSLHLSGSLKGTTSAQGSPTFQTWGTLNPLGPVKAAGHGSIETVTGPTGSFNLKTASGRVYVGTEVESVGKRSFMGEYQVEGGTGAYAGDTGSGPFAVTYSGPTFIATFG